MALGSGASVRLIDIWARPSRFPKIPSPPTQWRLCSCSPRGEGECLAALARTRPSTSADARYRTGTTLELRFFYFVRPARGVTHLERGTHPDDSGGMPVAGNVLDTVSPSLLNQHALGVVAAKWLQPDTDQTALHSDTGTKSVHALLWIVSLEREKSL